MAKKKKKKRLRFKSKAPLILLIALIVLILAGAAWYFFSHYLFFNGTVLSREETVLTVPEGDLPTGKTLAKMPGLTLVDLSGRTDTSPADIDALRADLPQGAEILWDVPLTDGRFSSRSTELTLPGCTESDVALFGYFPALTRVDASGSTAYEALFGVSSVYNVSYTLPLGDAVLSSRDTSVTAKGVSDVSALKALLPCFPLLTEADLSGGTVADADMLALAALYPGVAFRWTVRVGGKEFSSDETVPDLSGVTFASSEEAIERLGALHSLSSFDLCGTGLTDDAARAVRSAFPGATVRYDITLGKLTVPSDTEELDLSAETVDTGALTAAFSDMPALTLVTLPRDFSAADGDKLAAAFPDTVFIREVTLFGQTFSSDIKELDISGTPVTAEELMVALKQLPYLEKLVMCDCGPDNAAMDTLLAAYPNVKFVWNIQLGPHTLRTDAIGFSCKNPSKHYTSESSPKYIEQVKSCIRLNEGDIEALKYCTDLVALDLGHNYLTNKDLAVIAGLTHLKVLILADNKITDISALSSLKKLEYIELFMNNIKDISPICDIETLTDVNVCNTGLKNITPLKKLTNCKRLWYAMNPCSRSDMKAVSDALTPGGCECNYSVKNETDGGWRELNGKKVERYTWMRSFFE